jgi:hypothetical protein
MNRIADSSEVSTLYVRHTSKLDCGTFGNRINDAIFFRMLFVTTITFALQFQTSDLCPCHEPTSVMS